MSSGYSSLEEDAEDFFFTARTSFFRRAPQGKPRAGQQVSGVSGSYCSRAGTLRGGPGAAGPQLHVSSWDSRGMLAGKEDEAAEMGLLPFRIPGQCLEFVAGVRCARGSLGREAGARAGRPRALFPAAPDGLCSSASGARRLESSSKSQEASPGPSRRFPCAGVRPSHPRGVSDPVFTPAPTISPFTGLWPPEWLGGHVTARSGCGDLAAPTFQSRRLWWRVGEESAGRNAGPDGSRLSLNLGGP